MCLYKVSAQAIHDRRDKSSLLNKVYTDLFESKNRKFYKKWEMKSINRQKHVISSVIGTIEVHSPSYGLLSVLMLTKGSYKKIVNCAYGTLRSNDQEMKKMSSLKIFYSYPSKSSRISRDR